ncbi:bifunctional phosphatase PAP2/diacylglycerol kinase family protein [Lentzea sp. NBRC 105346]|uniref:bifunctional phosphatase PAP2/diacylglycerol kinase family protein n=1 Tax=Lentzea sp. NBRC 105346 TaxID=3032205 RepID=UPI002553AA1D|nr:bifunctional phosphatase PAP2/diacylglycerol kinase family protein [Lentzea sp. NBRC 105346]
MRRSAALRPTWADLGFKRLTRAANHSVLWFCIAALLAIRKGPARRAALRGVVAISGASTSANLVGKTLFPRRRPAAELLPVPRRLSKRPTSSSFPSGHSASAAAFTTAVAMESPKTAAVIAPIAAAVAYSRVHTGVHWPSDVAAGTAVGVSAALLTRRWWPLGVHEPASAYEHADLTPLVDGEGLVVVVNPSSGLGWDEPTEAIAAEWPRARIVMIDQLSALPNEEVLAHAKALGVSGGDGTVAAVAAIAAERDLPLVLIPAGTLNHFARDVGITGLHDTAVAVAEGFGVRVDLATVNDRWFVNTASLGGYPDMVRLREKLAQRWGKWPAAGIALARVLRTSRPLHMEINGEKHLVWMLFVGNGPYRPKGFAPTMRPRLNDGLLDVRYIRADRRFSRLRFFLGALLGSLEQSRTYKHTEVRSLDVRVLDGRVAIATDGEVGAPGDHFVFRSRPAALGIYRP